MKQINYKTRKKYKEKKIKEAKRALAKNKPVGMFQFDSHSDTWDSYFGGYKYTHGTPFRRAIEENLINPEKYVILGLRGSLYDPEDLSWARKQGVTIISIDEYYELGFKESIKKIYDVYWSESFDSLFLFMEF